MDSFLSFVLPPTGTTVQKGTAVGVAAPRLPDYGLISLTVVDQNVPQVGAVQLHLGVRPGRFLILVRRALPGRCAGRDLPILVRNSAKEHQ